MIVEDEEFDDIDVAGGGGLPKDRLREGLVAPKGLVAKSQVDKRLVRLLTLHPQLQTKFRNNSLAGLDDDTKEALIKDLQDSLGIVPLRNA